LASNAFSTGSPPSSRGDPLRVTNAGYSALKTGLAFLPLTVGVMLAAAMVSQLMTSIPPRFVMGAGLLLGAAGMALLTRLDINSAYPTGVLPALIMIGFGMGMVLPSALTLATFGVRPREAGVSSAMFNVSQQAGASLDTALLNTVAASAAAAYVASHGAGRLTQLESQVHGYNMATLWAAGILTAAGLIALTLINTRLGQDPRTEAPAAAAAKDPAADPMTSLSPHRRRGANRLLLLRNPRLHAGHRSIRDGGGRGAGASP